MTPPAPLTRWQVFRWGVFVALLVAFKADDVQRAKWERAARMRDAADLRALVVWGQVRHTGER